MVELLTKNDYAYRELRRRIFGGDLEAGHPIPQARLAEEIGVSTTPLREAIKRLAADGLVELTAHRDARVTPLTSAEASQLYEVRESLDPLAAGLAAQRRTDADLVAVDAALAALEPIRDQQDLDGMEAHRAFHRAVYTAAHNPVLASTLERLWDKADLYRAVSLRDRPPTATHRARVAREHRDLAAAVRAGDGAAASEVMARHVAGSHGRRAVELLATDD